MMKAFIFFLSLASAATINNGRDPKSEQCRNVEIPITVSVPRYNVTTRIHDNWDVASLVLNLTRRDSSSPADPLPVASEMSGERQSTYNVSATICGEGTTALILTHGIIESKRYWQPDFPGNEKYNFVNAAVKAGYTVISYDRIGVGSSSTVDSLEDAQFQVETVVLNALVAHARQNLHALKVGLVGHSYGSYLTAASASQVPVDAIVLTGFSGRFDYFAPFLAGASLRVAQLQDPRRWGHLDSGYLTASDIYATAYIYFTEPYYDHRVAEWAHEEGSEPFAVGELPSLLKTTIAYDNITAPVLVLQGQFDLSACGGNCVGVVNGTKNIFTKAKVLEYVDNLPAGHNLNLHHVAEHAFDLAFKFLKRQGLK